MAVAQQFESVFKGDFQTSDLSLEDQVKLVADAKAGDPEAIEKIHAGLDGFVLEIAHDILKKWEVDDFLGEVYSVGHLGIDDAIQKYDPSKVGKKTGKPVRLTTYFYHRIRRDISRYLGEQSRTIRVPNHTQQDANNLSKDAGVLSRNLKREPTIEELAEYSGKPVGKIKFILDSAGRKFYPLEGSPNGIPEASPVEKIAYQTYRRAQNSLAIGWSEEYLNGLKDSGILSELEAEVIGERIDTNLDGKIITYAEIGKATGFTGEQIRKIYERGLTKIRRNPKALELLELNSQQN